MAAPSPNAINPAFTIRLLHMNPPPATSRVAEKQTPLLLGETDRPTDLRTHDEAGRHAPLDNSCRIHDPEPACQETRGRLRGHHGALTWIWPSRRPISRKRRKDSPAWRRWRGSARCHTERKLVWTWRSMFSSA